MGDLRGDALLLATFATVVLEQEGKETIFNALIPLLFQSPHKTGCSVTMQSAYLGSGSVNPL